MNGIQSALMAGRNASGVQSSLKLGGGVYGGYEIGGAIANIFNTEAAVDIAVQPDVKVLVVAICIPVVALALHWLMKIDWDNDGKPDLADLAPGEPEPPAETKPTAT